MDDSEAAFRDGPIYVRKPDYCNGPDKYCGPCSDGYSCWCPTNYPLPKKTSKKPRKGRGGTRKKPRCRYCRLPMKGHPRFTCGYDYSDTYPQHYD